MVTHLDGPFDSAWLKWGWAGKHAEAFERDIIRFARGIEGHPTFTVRTEYIPKRHAFAIIVTSISALPTRWGLLLGDIASNYRSALDHVAWTLVGRGRTPPNTLKPGKQNGIAFPIAANRELFRRDLARYLPGARRADVSVIRRYQPYNRGPSRAPIQALSILATLNNSDKHREVQPVLTVPTGVAYKVTRAQDCIPTGHRRLGRAFTVDIDTEVGTIAVRRTGANPTLDVRPELGTTVSLYNRVPVSQWLDKTSGEIRSLLAEFSDPPAELVRLTRP